MGFGLYSFLNVPSSECHRCQTASIPSYFLRLPFGIGETRLAAKYGLYLFQDGNMPAGFREGSTIGDVSAAKLTGLPVLFVPGHGGGYSQVRQLASEAHHYSSHAGPLTPQSNIRLDFFAGIPSLFMIDLFKSALVDLNAEYSAFHGNSLKEQAEYLNEAVQFILSCYEFSRRQNSVIMVGHSMGGVAIRTMFISANHRPGTVSQIYSMASPHQWPPAPIEKTLIEVYKSLARHWDVENRFPDVSMVSIASGVRDLLVNAETSILEGKSSNQLSVWTTAIPLSWTSPDHISIVWCHSIARALLETIHASFDHSGTERSADDRIKAASAIFKQGDSQKQHPAAAFSLIYPADSVYVTEHTEQFAERVDEAQSVGDSGTVKDATILSISLNNITAQSEFSVLTDFKLIHDFNVYVAKPNATLSDKNEVVYQICPFRSGQSTIELLPYLSSASDKDKTAFINMRIDLSKLSPDQVLLVEMLHTPNRDTHPYSRLSYDGYSKHYGGVSPRYYDKPGLHHRKLYDGAVSPHQRTSSGPLLQLGIFEQRPKRTVGELSFWRLLLSQGAVFQMSGGGDAKHVLEFARLGHRLHAFRLEIKAANGNCACAGSNPSTCGPKTMMSALPPIVSQHNRFSNETKYFVDQCTILLQFFGTEGHGNLRLNFFLDPSQEYEARLSIDWMGLAGQLFRRYALTMIVFIFGYTWLCLAGSVCQNPYQHRHASIKSALMGHWLARTVYLATAFLLFNVFRATVATRLSFLPKAFLLTLDEMLGDPADGVLVTPCLFVLSAQLAIVFHLIFGFIGGAFVQLGRLVRWLRTRLIRWKLNTFRRPSRSGLCLLIFCCFAAPLHYAYLVVYLVMGIHVMRVSLEHESTPVSMNAAAHKLGDASLPLAKAVLYLMTWLQIVNAAPLLVWIKNIRIGWYSLEDHDPLAILPMTLLIYCVRSGLLEPSSYTTYQMPLQPLWTTYLSCRYSTKASAFAVLLGTGLYVLFFGPRYTYTLYHSANAAAGMLLVLWAADMVIQYANRRVEVLKRSRAWTLECAGTDGAALLARFGANHQLRGSRMTKL